MPVYQRGTEGATVRKSIALDDVFYAKVDTSIRPTLFGAIRAVAAVIWSVKSNRHLRRFTIHVEMI